MSVDCIGDPTLISHIPLLQTLLRADSLSGFIANQFREAAVYEPVPAVLNIGQRNGGLGTSFRGA